MPRIVDAKSTSGSESTLATHQKQGLRQCGNREHPRQNPWQVLIAVGRVRSGGCPVMRLVGPSRPVRRYVLRPHVMHTRLRVMFAGPAGHRKYAFDPMGEGNISSDECPATRDVARTKISPAASGCKPLGKSNSHGADELLLELVGRAALEGTIGRRDDRLGRSVGDSSKRGSFTRSVDTHDGLEEMAIAELHRFGSETPHCESLPKRSPNRILIFGSNPVQNEVHVSGTERAARGGDDWTLRGVAVRRSVNGRHDADEEDSNKRAAGHACW